MLDEQERFLARAQEHERAQEAAKEMGPVSIDQVNTELVLLRGAFQKALFAFSEPGNPITPAEQIQNAALREIELARLRYENTARRFDAQQAAKQLEEDRRLAEANRDVAAANLEIARGMKLWTIVVGIAAIAQTLAAIVQACLAAKGGH